MTININLSKQSDYLEVAVTGSYDMNDAIYKFSHVLDACRLTDLSKVLIDYKELQAHGSETEKSLYAFGVEEHYQKHLNSGGHELQVAYVGPQVMNYKPGVKMAKNGGLPYKLFDNRNEAFEWLNVKSS